MCTLLANSQYEKTSAPRMCDNFVLLSLTRIYIGSIFFLVLIPLYQTRYGTQNEYEILSQNKALWILTHMAVSEITLLPVSSLVTQSEATENPLFKY